MYDTPFGRRGHVVGRMLALCERLRGQDGCSWDRAQTLRTLTPYLLEEVHEVLDAIASGTAADIREELGDLLFVTVFALHAAETESIGTLDVIVDGTVEKLVRRHPHVFGDSPSQDQRVARESWQRAKREEQSDGDAADAASVLGRFERSRPALLAAFRMQERAAAVGFDFPSVDGALEKVREETDELRDGVAAESRESRAAGADIRAEIGDLLFAVTNVARFLAIDPEAALRGTNRRFYERFRHVERELARAGRRPEDVTLEEMDALWDDAKRRERVGDASSRDPD